MLYPTILRCSTVFQPILTVYAYIVKVSHDHVLLVTICNNLMHMWRHVTNHLIISNDKDSNSENRIKLLVRDTQQIAEKANRAKGIRTFEEMVPEPYRDFAKVFSEEESHRLPKHQPWDHAIDLEPDAVTHWKVKSYPMSPTEQVELDKWLEENLAKGYL
jgi:hypothetical protein